MALRRIPQTSRKAEADRSSMEIDRTLDPTYTSEVKTVTPPPHWHNLPGLDSVRQLDETIGKSSLTDTLGVAEKSRVTTPNYSKRLPVSGSPLISHFTVWILPVYYRIYAEDGVIPSKTPIAPGDPFLGRIKVGSVPPPRTAQTVKRSISKVENIKDRESTTLFLTPYSQSPMDDAEKVTILNGTGPGSTPQEPLALVAKMSDSERRALESEGRDGLAIQSSSEADTAHPEIRYCTSNQHSPTFHFITSRLLREVYYLLYADDNEMPSKVSIDPEQASLGRIRADSVAPPQSLTSIKRCISRVEGISALVSANLFADTSCDSPLKEDHISTLRTDGPGLSQNEPMAIVIKNPSRPDGKYAIKNRAKDIYWNAQYNPIRIVHFYANRMEYVKKYNFMQVNNHVPIVQVFEG